MIEREREQKRRQRARKRVEAQRRVQTPDAIEGRTHIEVQTDLYLEELSDKVPEAIQATQTDAFLDRPPSPLFIPQKSGMDVQTQIHEGDLFDFDYEVEPILEVLIGKTLEQSLLEVYEEEELENLRVRQEYFEERRAAELAETQRMEEAEKRRTEEKNRRLAEQMRVLKAKQEATEKVAARAFAQTYLKNLVPAVIDSLTANGYFYDIVEREIETQFLPWLSDQVEQHLAEERTARKVVDDILCHALSSRRT